jgi:hypothetical protein
MGAIASDLDALGLFFHSEIVGNPQKKFARRSAIPFTNRMGGRSLISPVNSESHEVFVEPHSGHRYTINGYMFHEDNRAGPAQIWQTRTCGPPLKFIFHLPYYDLMQILS